MSKYFGSFHNRDGIAAAFEAGTGSFWNDKDPFVIDPEFPTDEEILYASYGGGFYDGNALVLFERDGKLYEAHGSHCSCYGLEGQWAPEETSWAALAMRQRPATGSYWHDLYDHEPEALAAYWKLVDERTK